MDYLKIDDVAQKWGISSRRVQTLCSEGKIEGAVRFGRAWMIPKEAEKPRDGRTKKGRKNKRFRLPPICPCRGKPPSCI